MLSYLRNKYLNGTKIRPQNKFCTPKAPQNKFGTKIRPQNKFCTPKAPQNKFGTKIRQQNKFGTKIGLQNPLKVLQPKKLMLSYWINTCE
jgi:hypothetical protein